MGNFGQRDAQHELELYSAVIDVKCYELAALFLCSVFVPKCGSRGHVVRPCRSLCYRECYPPLPSSTILRKKKRKNFPLDSIIRDRRDLGAIRVRFRVNSA